MYTHILGSTTYKGIGHHNNLPLGFLSFISTYRFPSFSRSSVTFSFVFLILLPHCLLEYLLRCPVLWRFLLMTNPPYYRFFKFLRMFPSYPYKLSAGHCLFSFTYHFHLLLHIYFSEYYFLPSLFIFLVVKILLLIYNKR